MPSPSRKARRTRPLRLLLAPALLFATPSLGAQAIRVTAVEGETGRPVSGAVIDVIDAGGATAAQSLLGESGTRLVGVPHGGSYRIRVRRIGFVPFVSEPVQVTAADTVDVPLTVAPQRVALGAVTVSARRRCAADVHEAGALATLLEDARTALTATVLSRGERLPLEGRTFERTIGPDGRTTALRVDLPRITTGGRPFEAVSPAELAERGYVREDGDGIRFFAPDERVLASDEFVAGHCFGFVRENERRPGFFGIRFEPAPGSRVAAITGVIWLDSASAELRTVDFWYDFQRLPRPARGPDRSGGQVVFDRLANGLWIVSAWRLRMPRFASPVVTESTSPESFEEIGGVVTPRDRDPATAQAALLPYLELLRPARISGVVHGSDPVRPLERAIVRLDPVSRPLRAPVASRGPGPPLALQRLVDTTAADGSYSFDSIPAGDYRLAFSHESLTDAARAAVDLRVGPGETVVRMLSPRPATPTEGRRDQQALRGVLNGVVRDVNGNAIPGAVVSLDAAGSGQRRTMRTDANGAFVFRGLTPGVHSGSVEHADHLAGRFSIDVVGDPPLAGTAVGAETLGRRPTNFVEIRLDAVQRLLDP